MKKKFTIMTSLLLTIVSVSGGVTVHGADPEKLTPNGVAASSTLTGGDYDVYNIIDGDLTTAWVEGASGDGMGEFVDFFFEPGTYIDGGVIYPAYYKNQDIFSKNSGVTGITLQSGTESCFIDCTEAAESMMNGGFSFSIKDGIQCDGTLRVTIQSVRKGWKYQDTCISELYFVGMPSNS